MRAAHEHQHIGRRRLIPHHHGLARRCDDQRHRSRGHGHDHLAGRRIRTEQQRTFDAADVETTAEQAEADAHRVLAIARQDLLQPDGLAVFLQAQRRQVAALVAAECDHLDRLPAFEQSNLDRIAGLDFEHGRAATLDHIALDTGVERGLAGNDEAGPDRRYDYGTSHNVTPLAATCATRLDNWTVRSVSFGGPHPNQWLR